MGQLFLKEGTIKRAADKEGIPAVRMDESDTRALGEEIRKMGEDVESEITGALSELEVGPIEG